MGPLVIVWLALGLLTLALALYRKLLAMREEFHPQHAIGEQLTMYRRMGMVDRWGSNLAVATAVLGALLLLAYAVRG